MGSVAPRGPAPPLRAGGPRSAVARARAAHEPFPALAGHPLSPRVLAGLAVAMLCACASQPPAPLRIGINAWPGYEHLYLAAEKGFFAEQGVQVKLVEFGSLGDTRRSFERGQVDGFVGTTIEVLLARALSRRRPQIVLASDFSAGADVIVARNGIQDVAGLAGKRVAAEPGSVNMYLLARALEQRGLRLPDVLLSPTDSTRMAAAFRDGQIDAAVTFAGPLEAILATGQAQVVFTSREIPGEIADVLAIAADVVAARPHDVAAVIRAFERARGYAVEEPDESLELMAEREQLSAKAFLAVLREGVELLGTPVQLEILGPGQSVSRALARGDRLLRETGMITGSADPENAVNLDPLRLVEPG